MTILLAWINAKYKGSYEMLFVAVILLDVMIIKHVYFALN